MNSLERMLMAARKSGMALKVENETYTFLPVGETVRAKRTQNTEKPGAQPAAHEGKTKVVHSWAEAKKALEKKFGKISQAAAALKIGLNFLYKGPGTKVSSQTAQKIEQWAGIRFADELVSTFGRWAKQDEDTEDELDSSM